MPRLLNSPTLSWWCSFQEIDLNYPGNALQATGESADSWWHHDVETYFALLGLCGGNKPLIINASYSIPEWMSCINSHHFITLRVLFITLVQMIINKIFALIKIKSEMFSLLKTAMTSRFSQFIVWKHEFWQNSYCIFFIETDWHYFK